MNITSHQNVVGGYKNSILYRLHIPPPLSLTFSLPHSILKSNDLRNGGNILCQNLLQN